MLASAAVWLSDVSDGWLHGLIRILSSGISATCLTATVVGERRRSQWDRLTQVYLVKWLLNGNGTVATCRLTC